MKKMNKRSDWFQGLLDAEQHVYEGYRTSVLAKVANDKYDAGQISKEAHLGIHDYLWFTQFGMDNR